jgi:hypothetical protein
MRAELLLAVLSMACVSEVAAPLAEGQDESSWSVECWCLTEGSCQTATLMGTVVDSAGAPVPFAPIYFEPPCGWRGTSITGSYGGFHLEATTPYSSDEGLVAVDYDGSWRTYHGASVEAGGPRQILDLRLVPDDLVGWELVAEPEVE